MLTADPEVWTSPDGAALAVIGSDNLIRLLSLRLDDLLARAVRRPTEAEYAAYGPLLGCAQGP